MRELISRIKRMQEIKNRVYSVYLQQLKTEPLLFSVMFVNKHFRRFEKLAPGRHCVIFVCDNEITIIIAQASIFRLLYQSILWKELILPTKNFEDLLQLLQPCFPVTPLGPHSTQLENIDVYFQFRFDSSEARKHQLTVDLVRIFIRPHLRGQHLMTYLLCFVLECVKESADEIDDLMITKVDCCAAHEAMIKLFPPLTRPGEKFSLGKVYQVKASLMEILAHHERCRHYDYHFRVY